MTDARAKTASPPQSPPAKSPSAPASPPAGNQGTPASPQAGSQGTPASPGSNHQAADIIEADDGAESGDGYDTSSDLSSNASTSLSSSVRDYNFENKRRYHKFKEGRYVFPNDEPEQEREDMKHAMVIHICDGALHGAPLDNPKKILDIGTGTGIWAIDMGDEYPDATVTGIDLSPIQPPFVPPNVNFVIDDAEAEWLYPDNSIDYIHFRHMAAFIKDWPRILAQAYRVLKPGGWVEIQEMRWKYSCDDDTMGPDYQVAKMISLIDEGVKKLGFDLFATDSNPARLEAAGFVNQIHDVKKVPSGGWAKDPRLKAIGRYAQAVVYDGLHAITIGPFTKGLGWTAEEVELFLVGVRKDMLDPAIHSYVFYHALAGQKPLESDAP